MTVGIAAITGFLAGRLVWVTLRPTLADSTFERVNFRDKLVPTAGGLVVPLVVLAVESGRVVLGALGLGEPGPTPARLAVLLGVTAFALLGVTDDLGSAAGTRGFTGHVRAVARGRLTTGAAKLVGGGATALVLAALLGPDDGMVAIARDAVLVALAANLANLFDRAPGRMLKAAAVAFAVLATAAGAAAVLGPVAVAVGAGLALLLDDLHERVMLGDTGANALGATLGLGAVVTMSPGVRTAVLVGLLALNAASEVVSFSRVIESVPPLRGLDRAGRRA